MPDPKESGHRVTESLRNQPIAERVVWYLWIGGVTCVLAFLGRWWGLLAVAIWIAWSVATESLARSLADLARCFYDDEVEHE